MTVLLTNDDGHQAEGLHTVRTALINAGIRVITLAPDGPRSGTARSATFRKPVRVELVNDDLANPVWACTGTPVDCVRVALLTSLAEPVQLVISGANQGANLGDDSTYSSTVGAATEGALLGLPAIAVSQQSTDARFRLVDRAGHDFSGSAMLAVAMAQAIMGTPPPPRSVLNVNVPGRGLTGPIEITTLGRRAWRRGGLVEEHTEEFGHGYYSFGVTSDADPPYDAEPGTDFAAITDGHACITPLSLDWGNERAPSELRDWLHRIVPVVARTTGLLASSEISR
jgi:5'-nucleotidase